MKKRTGIDHLERVEVETVEALRAWLAEHNTQSESVWLVVFKKHCGDRYIPWGSVVDELLCVGWIDGRTRRLDEDRTLLLIAPRKVGSIWSAVNRAKVGRLIAEGRMQSLGQAKVDAAKADGSWNFLDDIDALIVPDDLAEALRVDSAAQRGYDEYPDSIKKTALYWLKTAKRAPTRQRRIDAIVEAAREGKRPNQPND